MEVTEGEPLLKFLSEDDPSIQYPDGAGNSNTGAGVIAGYSYYVMGPSAISRRVYPGLWKLGPYRTDNGTGAGQPNAGSTRPYNWFDLVRTQKWNEYADSYEICGDNKGDRNIVTYTRTIKPGHYLRPIPQGQLDGMEMSADEKKNYQNPEYR